MDGSKESEEEEEDAKGRYVLSEFFKQEKEEFGELKKRFQLFSSQVDDFAKKKMTKEVHVRETEVFISWNTFAMHFYQQRVVYYQGMKEFPSIKWFVEDKLYSESLSHFEKQASHFRKNLEELFMLVLDSGLKLKVVE